MTDNIVHNEIEEPTEEGLSSGAKAGMIIGGIVLLAAVVGAIIFLLNSQFFHPVLELRFFLSIHLIVLSL